MIHQPCDQLGAAAIQGMVQQSRTPDMPSRDILVDFHLVIRESCGSKFAKPLQDKSPHIFPNLAE